MKNSQSQNFTDVMEMDSQSSNMFSDDLNNDNDLFEGASIEIPYHQFNEKTHAALLVATKAAFHDYHNKINDIIGFSAYFNKAIEDTWTYISISLENQIKELLACTNVPSDKVANYLNNAVGLLQMLTQFYTTVINLVPATCSSMKMLPETTGQIILCVFVHCRDSEKLYGDYLEYVSSELKLLFRACHELQLIYLAVLEKRFSFNLDDEENKNVLIEALRINTKIGQVVQSLDVKSMAEQWKALTAICEKYATGLSDTDICQESIHVLCSLIHTNINTTFEENQDEKVITRSLKVASFTMKILQKTCQIYRQSSRKNYGDIVKLLHYLWKMNIRCLEMSPDNTLASQMNNYVMSPADNILSGLLLYEEFINSFFEAHSSLTSDEELLKNGDNLLGWMLFMTSAIKLTAQSKRHTNHMKIKLVNCVYILLPYSHIWLCRRLHFPAPNGQNIGLFEVVLSHTAALALTMTNAEFNALERCMMEAVLGTDCVCALFSSHLWLFLARHISSSLLFIQLIWLCTMYKKLDKQKEFNESPQDIHMSHTMSNLFKLMDDEDKMKICKQFRLHDEDNVSLWKALRIQNLPADTQISAEEFVAEKLKNTFRRLLDRGDEDCYIQFIQIAKLASTCSFKNTRGIDDLVVLGWLKTCQTTRATIKGLDSTTVWFYNYVKALVALTDFVVRRVCEKNEHYIQVLHVICGLVRTGDSEMRLILTNILCKMATHNTTNKTLLSEAFAVLLASEDIVRNRLLCNLKEFGDIIKDYDALRNSWTDMHNSAFHITSECDSKYVHKCFGYQVKESTVPFQDTIDPDFQSKATTLERTKQLEVDHRPAVAVLECKEDSEVSIINGLEPTTVTNTAYDDFYFDSAGSENPTEFIEKPPFKKGKPNDSVDRIIRAIEENTAQLTRLNRFTPHDLQRIKKVCEELKNIADS